MTIGDILDCGDLAPRLTKRRPAYWLPDGTLPPLAGGSTPGEGYTVGTPEGGVQLESAVAKTIFYLTSDAETPFEIVEMAMSCSGTAGELAVELVLGTNAGAGEFTEEGSVMLRGRKGAKARTKAQINAKVGKEPTTLTIAKKWQFPLPMAPFILQSPLSRESGTVSLTAADSGSRVGLRVKVTTGASVKVWGYIEFEE